jgi:hypothetical protein
MLSLRHGSCSNRAKWSHNVRICGDPSRMHQRRREDPGTRPHMSGRLMMRAAVAIIASLCACGSETNRGEPSGVVDGDAAVDDAGSEADASTVDTTASDTPASDATASDTPSSTDGDDGGLPCGDATCAANQICVQDYCGGGPVQCVAVGDAGTCPAGWQFRASCPATGASGCDPPPCSDPPPRCADLPSACPGGLTCICLSGSSVCEGLSCASASGRNASCGAE